ncbi:GNAT family N-acetyltransferase [Isoptericola aurantiacus]|uniref:GNAT family N-acetyltransferase n=1 Tax=Isoptericola aurantiacus TaxID=3377839 RepID=UPI00383A5627
MDEPAPRGPSDGGIDGLEIREATIADLAAVARVDAAAGRPTHVEGLRAAVLDPDRLVVVARAGDVVVGWAKTHLFGRSDGVAPAGHYLGGVTVHPAWRRRGVGTALTAVRLDWLGPVTDRVHYTVNARNTASIALHRRWGFQEVARAPSFHRVRFAGGVGLLLTSRTSARHVDDAGRTPVPGG